MYDEDARGLIRRYVKIVLPFLAKRVCKAPSVRTSITNIMLQCSNLCKNAHENGNACYSVLSQIAGGAEVMIEQEMLQQQRVHMPT